ncbi:MAG: zinc dependent phospholipase C family protein [Ginsengibacter sp.]
MKPKIIKAFLVLLLVVSSIHLLFAWGAWGHKHINRAAVFALPDSMRLFYYNHIDFITEAAVVPDLRRGLLNDKAESPRHFIDIEDFGNIPVAAFPKTTKEAYAKYDSAFLNKTGYLPWYIQNLTEKLTQAFKKRSKSEILFLSAELGHYVGDAHMPLHTASNYNGQLTDQKGIHALWESTIPEMFGINYDFRTGDARYLPDVTAETWNIIAHTHSLEDTLLAFDKQTRKTFTRDNMYKKDAAGNNVLFYNQPVFSDAYATQFNNAMNGMVEKQLRLSIQDVANFWYTAWVDGGAPDLISLDDAHLTAQNKKNYKLEYKAWSKGKLLNLSNEKE